MDKKVREYPEKGFNYINNDDTTPVLFSHVYIIVIIFTAGMSVALIVFGFEFLFHAVFNENA